MGVQLELDRKREIVSLLLSKGIILDRTMLNQIATMNDIDSFHSFITQELTTADQTTKFADLLNKYDKQSANPQQRPEVSIVFSYKEEPKKRDVQDFIGLFSARYNSLKTILQNRKELQNLTSINRLNQKKEREQAAIIALVTDKQTTKSGNLVLTVEDQTGTIKAIVSQNSDGFEMAKETVLDEVIGIVGMSAGNAMFVSSIILPDIPIYLEMKKSPDEAYALFMGDFHFGSNVFLKDAFEKFISWIRGDEGNETQKELAKKVKYLFMVGDIVEGIGIYPDQDKDLTITDIYDQYTEFARYASMIPKGVQIIICPGNHDAMRISEPQPPLYKDFAEAIYKLPNVTIVSNPSCVNIHASKEFPGFDVLMYHGFSFPYYADTVESIRNKGGQQRVDLIMEFLLKRRHLAPSHTSTLYLPDANKDSLVIDKVPDFFVSGHIHRVSATNYRNVTLLSCSCWLEKTEYQEKMGLKPQPGRAVLVNLQTRKVKMLKFYDSED